jgi:hypothetical protein
MTRIVAFRNSSNEIVNVLVMEESVNAEDFYEGMNATSHVVLTSQQYAIIGESEIKTQVAPHPSWIWNEDLKVFTAPIPAPSDDSLWDEDSLSWQPAAPPIAPELMDNP